MFCNDCGKPSPDAARYCSSCGRMLWRPTGAPSPRIQPARPVMPTPPPYAYPVQIKNLYDPEVESIRAYYPDLIGVGGWLLWFCIVTTIISPIYVLINAPSSPSGFSILDFGLTGLWIVAGIGIWRESPRALGLTKILLFIQFGIGILLFIGDVALRMQSNADTFPSQSATQHFEAGRIAGRLIVGSIIWFAYFKRSKRVRVTFGRNI